MAICETPAPQPSAASKPARMGRKILTLAGWNKLRESFMRRKTFQSRPWLVSLAIHAVLMLILACLVLEQHGHLGDDAIWAIFDEQGEDRATVKTEIPELKIDVKTDELKADHAATPVAILEPGHRGDHESRLEVALNRVPAPEIKIPMKTAPQERPGRSKGGSKRGKEDGPGADWLTPGVRAMTAGRTGVKKGTLLKQFGGTPKTESAVNKGLRWLAQQQSYDGGWYLTGPYSNGMLIGENRVAATSMALLAFLGAGNTHQQGEYQRQVKHGLEWLVHQQAKSGFFGGDTPPHHAIYTHAQATLVLCEAFAMSQDPWLMPHAESALSYGCRAQGHQGGWRYEFQGDSDTSVSGWMMMALVSGKAAGLEVPDKTFKSLRFWIDSVSHDEGESYGYTLASDPTPSMTAVGLLCRMYLGWKRDNPAIDNGTSRLLAVAPFNIDDHAYYYWYNATQVFHHTGGPVWDQWNSVMREQLPAAQYTEGPEAGSWFPYGGRHDRIAGRLYTTCMAIYCLEVYYRHMPIYESPWNEVPPDS